VPTLLLQAADDPFLPEEALPLEAVRGNPVLTEGFQRRGGHVGFVESRRRQTAAFWAESEAARYLATHLQGRRNPRPPGASPDRPAPPSSPADSLSP